MIAGSLEYHIRGDPGQVQTINAGEHITIEPQQVHFVRLIGCAK